MSLRRFRHASFVAALAAFPFAPFAAAGEGDPQPVVSASVEGDSTISGVPEGEVLWDQLENCTFLATSSQDFTDFGVETECADDFVVPPGVSWALRHIVVDGTYFIFAGPADSVNVVVYESSMGLPSSPVATYDGLTPVAGLGDGDFVLELPAALLLGPGRYWISVQAVMPFFFQGQWLWHVRHGDTELERVFRNPDDFFHTGCTDFDYASDCGFIVGLEKPDHCFALLGEEIEECADLEIIKTASKSRVPIGERLTFILEVSNRGLADAVDVDVEDAIPDEFDIVSVHKPAGWTSSELFGEVKFEKDLMLAGESAVFEIEVRALRARQSVTNVATVESDTPECDPENNEDEVTVRIHSLSDPGIPTLSTLGLALLALLMAAALLRVGRGAL